MKQFIKEKIEQLLAKEFFCSLENLQESDILYSVNYDATQPYMKIMAYRNCVVVCTSNNLSKKMHKLLENKNRDEIFEVPFVYGQTIHYVPDGSHTEELLEMPDFECDFFMAQQILSLAGLTGFENSLVFHEDGSTSARAVTVAKDNGKVIGAAGAAESSVKGVWEIGVDVKEAYRNAQLGTYLVKKLTKELLTRNIVPFYSASVTNIGSQMVACRCGYIPFWVDTFGTVLDGSFVYNDMVKGLGFRNNE